MKRLLPSLLLVTTAACGSSTSGPTAAGGPGPSGGAPLPPPPADVPDTQEDIDLGVVKLPNPNFKPERDPASGTSAIFRTGRAGLGARVDSLPGMTPAQVAQLGPRLVAHAFPSASSPNQFTITLNNTGSGWQEQFMVQVPNVAPTTPAPLLVAFHKFGVSQNDIVNRTTFMPEALARGWYCVAPLGASQVSFNSLESQVNVQAVLTWMTSMYAIDLTRVYAAGFSMGGGCALGYAERHLDPASIRFAAIANHTGTVALAHAWANEPDDNDADDNVPNFGENLEVPDLLEFWYGAAPQLAPFAYSRCSSIDLDVNLGVVLPGTDMSRNIAHVPVLNWVAAADPNLYLYEQTDQLHKHIRHQNPQNTLIIVPGNNHTWNTLDETAVCDWLSQFTLQTPTHASTLADADGIWFHFQLEQDAAGAFTPFTWDVNPATNTFTLSATSNLKRLRLDTSAAGLTATAPLTVHLSTSDLTGDELILEDYTSAPSLVRRDGLVVPILYDALADRLTLPETDSSLHTWVITP
jgi:hypothetical protein